MRAKIIKPKFTVVIFYGMFGVGKYTVAKEFKKQTGYRFFHNHHTVDLVNELFERGTLSSARLNEMIRLFVFKEIAQSHINIVATHAYSADFISKTGLSDPVYVRKVQAMIEKEGGIIYFVHLSANSEIVLKRISGVSRKKFKKLVDPKIMKQILKEDKDWVTPAPVNNNIEIDNTKLSPKQVVKQVRKLIKI